MLKLQFYGKLIINNFDIFHDFSTFRFFDLLLAFAVMYMFRGKIM